MRSAEWDSWESSIIETWIKSMQIPLFPPPCFLPGMQTQGSPAAMLDHEVTWKIDSSAEEETNREGDRNTDDTVEPPYHPWTASKRHN